MELEFNYGAVIQGNGRWIGQIDGVTFYCRSVRLFWAMMFDRGLAFELIPITSKTKGPSLIIGNIYQGEEFICNVSHRALMVHRGNNNGDCVVEQSAGCLIPLLKVIDLHAERVIGKTSNNLTLDVVERLANTIVQCKRSAFLWNGKVNDEDLRKFLKGEYDA